MALLMDGATQQAAQAGRHRAGPLALGLVMGKGMVGRLAGLGRWRVLGIVAGWPAMAALLPRREV